MCGITGFWEPTASVDHGPDVLRRMTESIAHRGPDDAGLWLDPERGVGLGHRRLSILDLSPEGHQPMTSADGRYVIVFNGEIYNFLELRERLLSLGASFRGHSDTEVMLAGFVTWGLVPAIQSFTGMFAFGLWDRERRELHLVRDRMGEKPLYYGWMGNTFLFGSELKALRAHPAWRGTIDRNALTVYLRHNYIPAPYSIYEGIRKVRPATIVTVQADRSIRETPYWSLHEVAQRGLSEPMTDQVETIIDTVERQLRQTIKETMVADVPLGAFLSGGIDSSTVVALMQAESSRPVRTFTIGFHEAGYNEAEHAKAVARHLGTEHTELYLTQEEARTVIPRLPSLYDEPFADSSQIPTALVAQLTRRYVTVALSGDGGDEIFAGYNRYFLGRRIWRWIGSVPRGLRQVIAGRIQAVAPSTWDAVFRGLGHIGIRPRLTRPGNQVHKLADILAVGSEGEMYRRLVSHWRRPEQVVIGGTEWPSLLDQDPNLRSAGLIERMMYWDSLTYLPDDIMVKVDRATMGVSLESRAPFLDHRVVELAWRLPPTLRVRNNQGKWILRQILYRHVPASLVDRPKMGFGVPIDGWLRGPLKEWAEDLLSADRLKQQGYFHPALIRQRWTEHANGLRNWQYHLWDILMFQAWLAERDSDVRPTPLTSQGVTTHA